MALAFDLQHEQVKHLDLGRFTTVASGTSVKDVVKKMRTEGYNCALVAEGDKLAGIFTDRDVLLKVVSSPETWSQPIDTVMTKSPLAVTGESKAEVAISQMNDQGIRNMPVVDDNGKILGDLTHYAMIKFFADQFPESLYNLPPRPNQVSENRVGG